MELLEGLLTRRSIRRFTGAPVSRDRLETVLKAAMYAPSARDCQPWHFIVTRDRNMFRKIMQVHPYASMLDRAGAAILVCGDLHEQHGDGYWVVDCSAATENLLLAIHGTGLGGVWLGVHPREDRKKAMKELFRLPAHIEPLSLVAVGVPAEKPEQPAGRYRKDRIHWEQW
jgi:nitroreductase